MNLMRLGLLVAVLMTAYAGLSAAEAEGNPKWTASAELGYILTSGNSESETLISRFVLGASYAEWEHKVNLEALNTSQNDSRSAEKYEANLQSNYSLSKRSYAFSRWDWEKDRFSAYAYQASTVVGAGFKVVKTEAHELRLELAPGFRVSEPVVGGKQEEVIGRASESYSWKITEGAGLEQSLSSEYGDSNTRTRFKLTLNSQINGSLSMKAGFQIKHNSEVAKGADSTDRETSLTLVYQL